MGWSPLMRAIRLAGPTVSRLIAAVMTLPPSNHTICAWPVAETATAGWVPVRLNLLRQSGSALPGSIRAADAPPVPSVYQARKHAPDPHTSEGPSALDLSVLISVV